jgi:dihydropyrimidinase
VIRGGTVVSAGGSIRADVYVDGERIVGVGLDLPFEGAAEIDASGCYVLPGGVDPHTHMEMPFGSTTTCDNYDSGSLAAVCGGTTSIIDFVIQAPGENPRRSLERWRGRLDRSSPLVDVGFHMAVTDLSDPAWLAEVGALPAEGITSFKLFMAYPGTFMVEDDTLLQVMEAAAETGSLALVHAENGRVIDVLVRRALAAGNTGTPFHATTRPPVVEAEATARAIQVARLAGAALYVVHVSCGAALAEVERALDDDAPVRAETCTQYFVTETADLDRPDFEGGKYVFTPPPRARHEREHLWRAVRDGGLDVVSSDHAPFRWRGQKDIGRDDFSQIPNGAPGIEERMMVVHQLGVVEGRITLPRMVDLLCTNPARLFGLYPRKGVIQAGSDADIVVFDPEATRTLRSEHLHSKVDYSIYEGIEVKGVPRDVLLRGTPVLRDGTPVGERGHGRFLERDVTPLAMA